MKKESKKLEIIKDEILLRSQIAKKEEKTENQDNEKKKKEREEIGRESVRLDHVSEYRQRKGSSP